MFISIFFIWFLIPLQQTNQSESAQICKLEGTFQDPQDPTCRKYYTCSKNSNGILSQLYHQCLNGSFYDPGDGTCTTSYVCSSTVDSFTKKSTFICNDIGKYDDPSDPCCKNYFLCTLMPDGTFIQTLYSCPDGQEFDPAVDDCKENSSCLCNDFECSAVGRFKDLNDPLCTNYFLCTQMPNGSYIQTSYSCENSYFDPSLGTCREDYICSTFECTDVGRYSDPQDSTCSRYYLCTALPDGRFIKTEYLCNEGTAFDPKLEECSLFYKCPTDKNSATTLSVDCIVQKDNFECTHIGRFKKPDDATCTKYYLCSVTPSGSFIKTEYVCPDGTHFDHANRICSRNYQCSCTSEITHSPVTTTTKYPKCTIAEDNFECSKEGRFINTKDVTCARYFLCSLLTNGSYVQTEYSCPLGSLFDPELHLCSTLYQCPCSITTGVTTTSSSTRFSSTAPTTATVNCNTIPESIPEFVCSEKGRFVNLKDKTCTTYFLCSLLHNNSFVQSEYSCPLGSFFDPKLHICSVLYNCPCTPLSSTVETTTKTLTTATASPTRSFSTTTSLCYAFWNTSREFICTEKGRFFNPKDPTCYTYFLCSLLRNGSFIRREYSCPLGSFFDPDLHLCSVSYRCPCSLTTTTRSSTTQFSTTQSSNKNNSTTAVTSTPSNCFATQNGTEDFVCSEKGRFVNLRDATCTTYFLCSLLRNGSFVRTEYSCPLGSRFDPKLHLCSVLYKCPCSRTTTTDWQSTISSSSSTERITTTSLTTSTSTICFANQNHTENFICSQKGRFINPKDITCTTYFLCSLLRNGTLIQTEYPCPAGSYFDPELQLCSILYQCPCPTTQSTTSTFLTTTPDSFNSTTSETETTEISLSTSTATSTKTTTSICISTQNNTEIFVCSEKGRFVNPKDVTCTTYFLCSLLRNGSFLQTEYICPKGSFFDPELHLCSVLYQCSCIQPTESTFSTTETAVGPSSSTTSLTKTTETSTIQTPSSTTISSTTTTTVCLATQDNLEDFVCSEKGRFVNARDATCATYFLCSLLRNGSFIRTEYPCPAGSLFDPELQLCSILYQCPCITNQSTTPATTTKSSEITEISSSTIIVTSTTTLDCLATQNYTEEFICAEKGRFFNPRDPTCTTYFLCSLLRNGSFIQTEYPCPLGSFFDPELHLCNILYKCPCQSTQSTESTLITTETTVKPSSSTSLTQTTETSTTQTPSSTTNSSTTTTTVCLATQDNLEDFVCSEKSRFVNARDATCATYFLCSLLRNGSFIRTEYPCPVGSFFDPELQLCSILYQCPCTTNQSTTPATTTEASATDISSSTTILTSTTTSNCLARENYTEEFICSEKGRFFNPRDATCTTYFLCSLLRNGSFIQTEYPCPAGSFFDPELQLCSILYQCPCTSDESTTPLSNTTEASTTEISLSTTIHTSTTTSDCLATQNHTEEFICSEKGRFFNPRDPTCTTYFLCSLLRNGSFIQTEYPCPLGSFFDPELHLCNILYKCPCQSTQSTESTLLTTETTVKPSSSTSLTETTGTSTSQVPLSTTTSSTTTTSICLATQDNVEDFGCSEKGRFVNPRDVTCATYFLCSLLRNGSFIRTEYPCPVGSFFDPELQLCSILYQCPCVTNQSTTPTTTTKSSEITEISSSTTIVTSTTTLDCLAAQNYTEEFICSEKGRFFNPRDATCTTYFLCSLLRNGSFIQTEYPCPAGSFFDPELHLCNIFYKCPCQSTQSTETTSLKPETTVGVSSSTTSLTKTTETTTIPSSSITTISSTTTTSVCLATQDDVEDFACSEKGRFINPRDATCASYFLCSLLRNGSFIRTEYPCPERSFFDPELQLCSILYQCPCTSNQSTTSMSTTTEASTTEISSPTTILTSTTTSDCLATQNYTGEFICLEKGRFFNPRDPTCTTYFLCSLLRNGSFIQTEYPCPLGSFFDPGLQLCNILYQCPCQSTQSTERTSFTTETTVKPSSSITSLTKTTETTTTQMPSSTTTILSTTTSVCLATQDNVEDFACSEKGRFVNPRDKTCATYFLCSLLRNGSFIRTEYPCPVGSFFDPELQLCSILYQCPCITNQSTTSMSTTTETSTTEIFSPTTILTSTTTSDCLATQNYTGEFICSEKGHFFNPRDPTCTTYFLCSLLRNGSFIQTEYPCPLGSFFDPELQLCNILYQCPCQNTQSTERTSFTTATTVEPSSSITSLTKTTETTTTQMPSSTTTISSATTTYVCLATQDNVEGFTCSEKGRFVNPRDATCKTYFLCSLLRNGSFIRTEYRCPAGSFFDPELQLCSILYQCHCITNQSTTPATTTKSSDITEISSSTTIATSTTTLDCLAAQNYTEEFICLEKGRFFNPRDVTCTTYFLCSLLRNGSFIQTEYPCPAGSFFDPELHLCNIFYKCPCQSTQSTETTSLTPETTVGVSSSTTSLTKTTEKTTNLIPSSSTTISSTTTTPVCLATQDDVEDFACSEKGRFINPRDATCASYFLCSLLRNGSFIRTEYSCPARSFFDPELQLCSILYQCPCTSNQSTISMSTTTEASTTEISSPTTILTSTTISDCLATQNYTGEFICSEKGRFFNPRDPTCTTYFLCSLLRNGSFIQTEYPCPLGSFFDPGLQLCNILYQCPCQSTQSTERTSFTTETTVEPSSSTAPLNTTTETTTAQMPSSTTTISYTTTTSVCLATQDNVEDFACSEKGRFVNPKDVTCTTYFLCSLLRNGSFIQTEYPCPLESFFDPELQLCSILYHCPCTSNQSTTLSSTTKSSTNEISSSTTILTSTTSDCVAIQNYTEEFICSEKGRFFNPKDATCTTYFLCSLLRNGSFIQTEYPCPAGSFFDPELQLCSILYQCPCITNQSTTSMSTTTETSTTEIFSPTTILTSTTTSDCLATQNYTEEFICPEKGRFFNPRDPTCTTYFLCSLLRNGSFIQTEYPCPLGSFFDPELQLCNILYQCPCQSTQSTERTSFTTETTVEPSSSITSLTKTTETTTTQMPSSTTTISSTTTTSVCLATQENVEDFVCSEKGRFVNPRDITCATYFLCSLLRNGSFIRTEYPCPVGSFFDPELQLCSILYQCPCITNQSTTSMSSTTETSTTETFSPTTILTSTTTSDCLATQNYTEEFICSEKGRFFNPRDPTCTTYFLCSLLRNGSFIQTEYPCPLGSLFDPELQLCNVLYQCPCQSTQSTEKTSFTTETTVEPSSSITSLTKTTETTTTQMPSSTTTISSTTTTSVCLATQDNVEDFVCSEKGRFVNPRDLTCATYFLCSLLRNGSFIRTEYPCPVGSFFDPELQLCSILYQCPCITNQSTRPTTTTKSSEITENSSSTTVATSTTTLDCLASQNYTEEFICSEKGRFFNPRDATCTTYFLCSQLWNGCFIQTEYSCPEGSFFDPELQLCSILYQCPCLSITTDITATRSTTLDPCVPPEINDFTCSKKGRFLNQLDISCTSYYLCNLLRNGSFVQTKYVCPSGSYFDPSIQICNINYKCPCSLLE